MTAHLSAVWQLRYFWLSLVKHDLRSRYRRSLLGIGWSLLHPICMTAVLCTVFHRIFAMDIREFGPHLLCGLSFWGFISTSVMLGCHAFFTAESYIRQYPAPLAIYPLRVMLGAAFHLVLAMLVVLGLTWAFKGLGSPTVLLSLIPSTLLLLIVGWSLATLAGLANTHFSDTQHLSDLLLQVVFYMTPIIYPPEMVRARGMGWLLDYNPVAALLELFRAPILAGQYPTGTTIETSIVATWFLFLLAVVSLVRLQRQLVFHL